MNSCVHAVIFGTYVLTISAKYLGWTMLFFTIHTFKTYSLEFVMSPEMMLCESARLIFSKFSFVL